MNYCNPMIINPCPKDHLQKLRYKLIIAGYEDGVLKFLLADKEDNKFAVFMDCTESDLNEIFVDGEFREHVLFMDMLLNLNGLEVYSEQGLKAQDGFDVVKDLLFYFTPDHDYMKHKTDIENAILHHIGNGLGFKDSDHAKRIPRKSVTADQISENVEYILAFHRQYVILNDNDEYRKMISRAIWKMLIYVTDVLMLSGAQKNHMVQYHEAGEEVTLERLMTVINQDLNYFDHGAIKADMRRFDISPSVKRYDFTNVIVPITNKNIDHVLSELGTINLYHFQMVVFLTYRNYLISKGTASNAEINKIQDECQKLFYNVIDNKRASSFEILDGLYKIEVARELMTGHINFSLTIADEVLDSIEISTVLAC